MKKLLDHHSIAGIQEITFILFIFLVLNVLPHLFTINRVMKSFMVVYAVVFMLHKRGSVLSVTEYFTLTFRDPNSLMNKYTVYSTGPQSSKKINFVPKI